MFPFVFYQFLTQSNHRAPAFARSQVNWSRIPRFQSRLLSVKIFHFFVSCSHSLRYNHTEKCIPICRTITPSSWLRTSIARFPSSRRSNNEIDVLFVLSTFNLYQSNQLQCMSIRCIRCLRITFPIIFISRSPRGCSCILFNVRLKKSRVKIASIGKQKDGRLCFRCQKCITLSLAEFLLTQQFLVRIKKLKKLGASVFRWQVSPSQAW